MGNRLLLADDSITIQKVVAIIFANEEFELAVVDNGNAALEKAREIQPDLMLVDALMPGKSGYEVCTEIRRDPKLGTVPLLLLIGAFEPLDEEKAKSCGADATITKPFESQQLIDKVKELLEVGKSRKAAAPAAAPQPAAAPAQDIWGDLSALDTMTSFTEPAPARPAPAAAPEAKPAAARAAQPAPAAPAYQAPAAPVHAAPAAPAHAAPAAAPAFEEEIQEASFEDDLWGAFELEELPQAAAAAPSTFGAEEPEGEFEAEEFFTFEEEEGIEETGPALELVEEPVAKPSAEELFSFEEESPFGVAEAEPAPEVEPIPLPDFEPFALEEEAFEPAPAAAQQAASAVPPVEPQEMPFEPFGTSSFEEEAAPAPAAAAGLKAQPGAGLSEADLVAALSKISREVIERIVWEVVPDLAENLIKEEIKKLKAGGR